MSQAHGHNHIVQCFACCTAAYTSSVPHQVAGGGGGARALRAALLQFPGEAAKSLEDLVQEVPVRPRVETAEDVMPPGRGMDFPRLRQGGPPDVRNQGEEGMQHVGQFQPRGHRPRVGGGGWWAGSLRQTRAHRSTPTVWALPAAVSPSKRVGRRSGRRCQQAGGSP